MEYKKNCPGCNREMIYKTEKSLKKSLRKDSSCVKCANKVIFVSKDDAIEFYRSEIKRQGITSFRNLDKSSWPNNIPKAPERVYKMKWSEVSGNTRKGIFVSKDDVIDFYRSEIKRQGISTYNKLDKSSWPNNIPKDPLSFYNMKWVEVSGVVASQNRLYVSKDDAIEFYRSEIKRQGITSFRNLDKSSWPNNIPNKPMDVYDMKWSEITGNTATQETSRQNKQEIARLVLSYGPVFDTLDDTLILIILSKLSDKKISSIIKNSVRKIANKVIEKETPEERALVLNQEVNNILNDQTNDYSDDAESNEEADIMKDLEEVDVNDINGDTNEDITEDVQSNKGDVEVNLKRKIAALQKAILSEDIDVDIKELMRKNALKYMWYLEFYK